MVEMAHQRDAILISISQMSVQELESILLDLSGRLELSVGEVDLFYHLGEELERRRSNENH